jgi:putative transposase
MIFSTRWTARPYISFQGVRLLAFSLGSATLHAQMRYDRKTHHRRSIRLASWDYRDAGAYFVTLCTFGRECIFADPRIDRLLRHIWARTVGGGRLPGEGDFVVMPNHIHGIVWVRAEQAASGASGVGASRPRKRDGLLHCDGVPSKGDRTVSVDGSPLREADGPAFRRPERGSLGALIASFKIHSAIGVNKLLNTSGAPVWQRSYYERIIRDDEELLRIREYIRDNPRRWAEDPDNPNNLPANRL